MVLTVFDKTNDRHGGRPLQHTQSVNKFWPRVLLPAVLMQKRKPVVAMTAMKTSEAVLLVTAKQGSKAAVLMTAMQDSKAVFSVVYF